MLCFYGAAMLHGQLMLLVAQNLCLFRKCKVLGVIVFLFSRLVMKERFDRVIILKSHICIHLVWQGLVVVWHIIE